MQLRRNMPVKHSKGTKALIKALGTLNLNKHSSFHNKATDLNLYAPIRVDADLKRGVTISVSRSVVKRVFHQTFASSDGMTMVVEAIFKFGAAFPPNVKLHVSYILPSVPAVRDSCSTVAKEERENFDNQIYSISEILAAVRSDGMTHRNTGNLHYDFFFQ